MLERLSDKQFSSIKTREAKRAFCFMPVSTRGGWVALAEAFAGEDGYKELPLEAARADSYAEMSKYAEELNSKIGCSPVEAAQIVASTPHGGGKGDEKSSHAA